MIAKRIFYFSTACLSILSFWAPVQFIGLTLSAGEYFLVGGTLSILLEYMPIAFFSVSNLLQTPNMITDLHEILFVIQIWFFTMAEVLHNYAILGLIAWSFLMIATTLTPISIVWRKLYRIWLGLSIVSSLLMSLNPFFDVGSGFGYWLNPTLLIFAAVGELLFFIGKVEA